jgi:hypothetical protein
MTHVRHFYVDNLLGNVKETTEVAKVGRGDYPVGSVIQLVLDEDKQALAQLEETVKTLKASVDPESK